jgi:hypothetical protein
VLRSGLLACLPYQFVMMLIVICSSAWVLYRNPLYSGQPRLLRRLLCKKYLPQLQARTTAPTPWLNSRINSSNVLYVLDSGESSELLHQCYAYMTYGTGRV